MLVLANASKLYDGRTDQPQSIHTGVDLVLSEGKVHALEEHNPNRTTGGEVEVVDASNWIIAPGLIDCHGHITALGLDQASLEKNNEPAAFVYVEKVLHRTLVDGGVTTMRDIGGATHAMKRLVEDGLVIGPRLKVAICMLSSTAGHADFRGPDRCHATISKLWPPMPGRPSSIVDGPWDARKRVRELAGCGADLIKLCTSAGVASPSDGLDDRDLHPEEIAAICDEAAARGLRVAAHSHSAAGCKLAVENGVHDLQHISFLDEEGMAMAHARDATVTPTSWIIHELQTAPGLSDFVRDKARQAMESHAHAVDLARRGGLRILGGTDPVLPGMHGRNFMELVYLVKDGLDPLQAWWGMTGLAAQEIGQDDAGTLEPGQRADFLICTEDVLSDPGALDRGALLEVVQDGHGHRGGVPSIPQRDALTTVNNLLGDLPTSC
jgi:imidazolonepropionase-like amidohydrolase